MACSTRPKLAGLALIVAASTGAPQQGRASIWQAWALPADADRETHARFCTHIAARTPDLTWLGPIERRQWVAACSQLPLWAQWPAGRARVFHHACHASLEPSAADGVVARSLQLAFEYFLGRPEWALRDTCNPTAPENLEEADISAAAVFVGGGQVFSLASASTASRDGRQWSLDESRVLNIEAAPLTVFGVRCGSLCGRRPRTSERKRDAFAHALENLLAHPNSEVGLQDLMALPNLRTSLNVLPGRLRSLVYQPCPTTLLGLLRPGLASTVLRSSETRVLSLDATWRVHIVRSLSATGGLAPLMAQLAHWCRRASKAGWTIHLTALQQPAAQEQAHETPLLDYLEKLPERPFPYKLVRFPAVAAHSNTSAPDGPDLVEYYARRVTVAVSTRAHGVTIPFGLHVATIALVVDAELDGFVRATSGQQRWAVELIPTLRNESHNALTVSDELWRLLGSLDANRDKVRRKIKGAQGTLMSATAANMYGLHGRLVRRLGTLSTRHQLATLQPAGLSLPSFVNLYPGSTIYVVGSGKTAEYISHDYFDSELAIGVNQAFYRFTNLTYLLRKEPINKVDFSQVLEQAGARTMHFVARGRNGDVTDHSNGARSCLCPHRGRGVSLLVKNQKITALSNTCTPFGARPCLILPCLP